MEINFADRRTSIRQHPLLRDFDPEEAERHLSSMPLQCFASYVYGRPRHMPLIQPRGGFALWQKQRDLSLDLRDAGADFIPLTIDSHTRQGDFQRASALLQESERENANLLNGYPLLAHGAELSRSLFEGIFKPISLRHGTPDARILVEAALDSGITEIEGGGLSYCLPYSRNYPVDRALFNWQYIDRLCGHLSKPSRAIHRESFGPLTATMVPPVIVAVVEIIELMLAIEQGVLSFSVSFSQTGSLTQDLALACALRELIADNFFELQACKVSLVFHQWMGAFPLDRAKADGLITQGAMIAALCGADKVVVKTRKEAHGIPTNKDNADAVALTRQAMMNVSPIDALHLPSVSEEKDMIKDMTKSIVSQILDLPGVALWEQVYTAVMQGLIDIPFSPHKDNRGKIWTARDASGAIRINDPGLVPISKKFMQREKHYLAAKALDKSLDSVLHDVLWMTTERS